MPDVDGPELRPEELRNRIFDRLSELVEMSFLERFAVFMGKAQVFELGLERLLVTRYQMREAELERKSMGGMIHELEERRLRPDFLAVAKRARDSRNEVAHSLLASDAIGKFFVGHEFERLSEKTLRYALWDIEHAIQVFDFLDSNNLWTEEDS